MHSLFLVNHDACLLFLAVQAIQMKNSSRSATSSSSSGKSPEVVALENKVTELTTATGDFKKMVTKLEREKEDLEIAKGEAEMAQRETQNEKKNIEKEKTKIEKEKRKLETDFSKLLVLGKLNIITW